jgi:hypothetical protein
MPDFVQIQLHDNGEGIEAVWARAVDAGLYEIASVPFLHMSPTAGDVVAVHRDDSGALTYEKVVRPSGRWVAVYNWYPREGATSGDIVARLASIAKGNDLVVEKALEPSAGVAGCVYVAAPSSLTPEQLDSLVRNAGAPADLERVLPVALSPAKPSRLAKASAASAKSAASTSTKAAVKAKPAASAPKKSAKAKSAKSRPAKAAVKAKPARNAPKKSAKAATKSKSKAKSAKSKKSKAAAKSKTAKRAPKKSAKKKQSKR